MPQTTWWRSAWNRSQFGNRAPHEQTRWPLRRTPRSRRRLAPSISTATAPPGQAGQAARLEKWLLRRLLAAIGNPPLVFVLWNGEEIVTEAALREGATRIRVHDRGTLWRILVDPFFQFPEAYANGKLDIDGDLEQVMCLIGRSAAEAPPVATRWLTLIEKALHWGGRTTMAASQKNIHHHYDIGNDFYRLWLDENLLYTCAYFEDPGASLEAAQIAKMDHVCRKVVLQPGETVIEAGCGWGGFALHMARHYGVRVRAYNISKEQVSEARSRAKAEGLDDRVEFILDDWRNITGKCDVFMSIGMLEHVGLKNYRQLGDVIDRCLSPNGRGLIHSIGRNRHEVLDPWIERRIFPARSLPLSAKWGRSSSRTSSRFWKSRTCGCTTPRRCGTGWPGTRSRSKPSAKCTTHGSCGCGGCTSPGRSPLLIRAPCSSSRCCSRGLRLNDLPLTRAHQYTHLASRDGQPACSGPGAAGAVVGRAVMQNCEVLIVGGGPAGSSCAGRLVQAGLDVLVIDRKTFPRDKTCAGWVTPQVFDVLGVDPDDYANSHVCQPITGFRTGMIGGDEIGTEYGRIVSYGIRRCEFDHFLLERSGAPCRFGETVHDSASRRHRLDRERLDPRRRADRRGGTLLSGGPRHSAAARGDRSSPSRLRRLNSSCRPRTKAACTCAAKSPSCSFARIWPGTAGVSARAIF